MKAKGTPEKIYLQVCGDCNMEDCDSCKFEDLEDNVTWCKDRIFAKDVEYIRSDAFIKKAYDWLLFHANSYIQYNEIACEECLSDDFLKDFKNYMKGE